VPGLVVELICLSKPGIRSGVEAAGVITGFTFGHADGLVEASRLAQRESFLVYAKVAMVHDTANGESGLVGCRGVGHRFTCSDYDHSATVHETAFCCSWRGAASCLSPRCVR
jgi:hypothetical protein